MATVFDNIKYSFLQKKMLSRLIIINVVVFMIIRLVTLFITLLKLGDWSLLSVLALPSSLPELIRKPWTLITYMFVHYDFLHILFNMLWLYLFGKIFLNFFNNKQLLSVYLLGGIAGALFFLLTYNIFPYFSGSGSQYPLIGASGAVMAIVFAASFYKKDFSIQLLFIGNVKISYIAIASILIDFMIVTSIDKQGNLSNNFGGHIVHLGGALFGLCYALAYREGKDMTAPLNKLMDRIVNLFSKKPPMRVTHHRRASDYAYNNRKNKDMQEIDQILDKIKKSGYNSLSSEEKKRLFDAGK